MGAAVRSVKKARRRGGALISPGSGICQGVLWIMAANIIRLFSICLIINWFGNESYYVAHTIVGRLLFYALSIILYFYVFTRAQIRKQRVGEFGYDSEVSK